MKEKRLKEKRGRVSPVWILGGILFLLLLWECGARLYGSSLILPGPASVLGRFFSLVTTRVFRDALLGSFLRVLLGISIAVPLGAAAGIVSGLDGRVRSFLSPFFSFVSATPVMSLILIAFLFLGAERTPVFTAFLTIFPVMTANTLEGMGSLDPRLEELFRAFKMSGWEKVKSLYIPSLSPFVIGGLRSSLSLCWKVVAAAEVLVQPAKSLGAGMQQAKANLETPELFAWTLAAVIAASLTQGFLSLVLKLSGGRR